jgi:tetratricopeptide (TPR) repeat protein
MALADASEIGRAEVMLLYCYYDMNQDWDRDSRLLTSIQEYIGETREEANSLVEEGIRLWDRGDREAAAANYRAALAVHPRSPWALWELGHDRLNSVPDFQFSPEFHEFYAIIRQVDPHYELAWFQGDMSGGRRELALTLRDDLLPAYYALWQGKDPVENMRVLGDSYFEIGEYEFAFYAYKWVLFHTFTGQFDRHCVAQARLCLEELGMAEVVPYFNEFLVDAAATARGG